MLVCAFIIRFCVAFLVLYSQAPVARGKLKLDLKHMELRAGSSGTISWHRDHDDPKEFFLVKFLHKNHSMSASEPYRVDATESSGTFHLPFTNDGKFHVAAFHSKKHLHKPIASTDEFQVEAVVNHNIMQPNSNNSIMTLPTPSSTVIENGDTDNITKSHPIPSGVAVGVVIGALLGAILGIFLLYCFLRRRSRRMSDDYPFASQSVSSASAAPPSDSNSFWSRFKFWNRGESRAGGQAATRTAGNTIPMSSSSTTIGAADPWDSNRNFYKTPKVPRNPFTGTTRKSSSKYGLGLDGTAVTGDTGTSLSSIRFQPNTERQMEIDERIEELTGKLALFQRSIGVFSQNGPKTNSRSLATMTHDLRVYKWKNQIERLQELKNSDWAWGKTDVIPPGLYGSD